MKRLLLILPLLLVPFFGTGQPAEKACFSVPGGFYEESPTLEIFPFYQQHHIRFTTNGNRPTAQSQLYTEPLLLDGSLYSTSDIYTIQISTDEYVFVPDSVPHCIVIRAAVFDQNENCISEVATHSYFIHSLGCDTHGLPVVSLCADSLDLFDYYNGILVPGVNYDPLDSLNTGNYYQSGHEWERPVNVEYYDHSPEFVNQLAGLRVQGLKSRRFEQKALKLYAREEYGKKRFVHHFFETIPHNSFKHLTLKPFYATFNQTGINDYLSNRFAASLNLETLASSPAVLFLNGEYWGIYFVHEKPDERYLEDHFGIDPEQVTILSGWEPEVDCGNPQNYIDLFQWMSEADLSDPEAYAFAASKIDIDNFIDYYVFELFSENTDWPNNNMRCWQLGDSKWRWIFFDGDACYCWVTFQAFDNAVYDGPNYWPSSFRASLFFRKLLANPGFRYKFNNRFKELMSTTFSYDHTSPVFEEIKNALAPEIPAQAARFGKPVDFDDWNTYLLHTQWFLLKRKEFIEPVLEEFMHWSVSSETLPECNIYPNPTHRELTLEFDGNEFGYLQIEISDLLGRVVFSQPFLAAQGNNKTTIHPNLKPGLYVLKIGNHVTKIVLQ